MSKEGPLLNFFTSLLQQKFMPAAVTDMVANVSRISSACQLLQADTATQVSCLASLTQSSSS